LILEGLSGTAPGGSDRLKQRLGGWGCFPKGNRTTANTRFIPTTKFLGTPLGTPDQHLSFAYQFFD
jgi:hypothetical protein